MIFQADRIHAGVNKHFSNAPPVPIYFEGAPQIMAVESAEVRMDGPQIQLLPSNGERYFVTVNVMCVVKDLTKMYRHIELASLFVNVMIQPIIVSQNPSNGGLIRCLALRDDVDHQLEIVNWGKVSVGDDSAMQASVEAFYKLEV